ncbi:hypothetical protein Taro_056157, partial [Colocasia esculenta]|nr:hypothetical protein [Colocasia esculenta]
MKEEKWSLKAKIYENNEQREGLNMGWLLGWNSLERQFEGCAVLFGKRRYSSWVPTWSAYTSSAAVALPFGRADAIRVSCAGLFPTDRVD